MKKLFYILSALFLFSAPAFADVVWPSLYIVGGMMSAKVIIAGLLIEFWFVKFFTKTTWLKAGLVAFVMNLITCLLGIVIIPISGLLLEFVMYPINRATFHWTHWVASYLVIVVMNTLIEGLVVKFGLKQTYKSVLWWLFIANTLSVLMCILFMAFK